MMASSESLNEWVFTRDPSRRMPHPDRHQPRVGESGREPTYADQEVFQGASRRGRGQFQPSHRSPLTFGRECDHSVTLVHPDSESSSYFGSKRSYGGGGCPSPDASPISTRWRKGDTQPFALSGEASPSRVALDSVRKGDDPVKGYDPPAAPRDGYGAAFLFGDGAAPNSSGSNSPRPNLDLQIAQWRISASTNDPHPFTLAGEVNAPGPRRDPRRQKERDVVLPDAPPAFPPPDCVPRTGQMASSGWRKGDYQPIALYGDSVEPPSPSRPFLDSTWRKPDRDGVAVAFGGGSPRTINTDASAAGISPAMRSPGGSPPFRKRFEAHETPQQYESRWGQSNNLREINDPSMLYDAFRRGPR